MDFERLDDGSLLFDPKVSDWERVSNGLAEAWPGIAEAAARRLKDKPPSEWDRLRAYVRFDGGIIWFSLETARPRMSCTVAGVTLGCMEELYFQLPSSLENEAEFERQHAAMSHRVFDLLRQSVLSPEARPGLLELQRIRPHAITMVQYDDLETDRVVATAEELGGQIGGKTFDRCE